MSDLNKIDRLWPVETEAPHFQATIFAAGNVVGNALQAAQFLDDRGFQVQVFNVHTLKPIDPDLIAEAARRSSRFVTVEDPSEAGKLNSAVCESLAQSGPGTPVVRLKYGLSAEHIAEACLRNLE